MVTSCPLAVIGFGEIGKYGTVMVLEGISLLYVRHGWRLIFTGDTTDATQ
jgi:hypothetical protein